MTERDYRVLHAGWIAGRYRKKDEIVRLSDAVAKYEAVWPVEEAELPRPARGAADIGSARDHLEGAFPDAAAPETAPETAVETPLKPRAKARSRGRA